MTPRHRSNPGAGAGQSRYPGTFLLAFREALGGLDWQIKRWLGDAVEVVDKEGREQVIGLENLYRRAKQAERVDWPELIADFLQTSQSAPIDNPPEDLATVADKLLCRLGPPMSTRSEGPAVWQKEIDDTGLVICLVIDFPKSMFYVTTKMVEDSGKPGEDWLAQALVNLQQQTPADTLTMVHEESGVRRSGMGDAYDTSRVLLLDNLVPDAKEYGCLVALPGRDELLVMPVTAASLQYLPMLKVIAEKSHKSAPYPISDQLFWIRDGKWYVFAVEVRNDQAHVQPPEEFLPVLHELVPEALQRRENDQEPEPEA